MDAPAHIPQTVRSTPLATSALLVRIAPLALAVAVWPAILQYLDRPEALQASASVEPKPLVLAAPWAEVAEPLTAFKPSFHGYRSERLRHYSDGKSRVAVYVATYAQQAPGRELVQSENMLLQPADPAWSKLQEGKGGDSRTGTWHSAVLSVGSTPLVVWSGYWINGRLVTSDYVAKGLLAIEKLQGHADRSAYVAIWATGQDAASVYERTGGVSSQQWSRADGHVGDGSRALMTVPRNESAIPFTRRDFRPVAAGKAFFGPAGRFVGQFWPLSSGYLTKSDVAAARLSCWQM